MAEKDPVLRIENISKRYGEKEVLRDASLSIHEGDLKILIGPSGGGKSTLLQCINFLIMPDKGRIWLDGKEVNHKSKKELYGYRQKVGMIFQDFNLFDHLTALKNVEIGLVKVRKMSKAKARDRAVMELEGAYHQISGRAFRRAKAEGIHRPGPGHGPQCDAPR